MRDHDGSDGDEVLHEHEEQRVEELVHGVGPSLGAHLVQHQVGVRQVKVVSAVEGRKRKGFIRERRSASGNDVWAREGHYRDRKSLEDTGQVCPFSYNQTQREGPFSEMINWMGPSPFPTTHLV